MRVFLAFGLAFVIVTTAAWGQNPDQSSNGWFRVSWQPRPGALPSTIEGHVYNNSTVRVTDVRLQVEGLDADSHPVGQRLAWAIGDIVPGGETSYVAETIPGAVNYRVTVLSFDLVSVSQAP